MENGNKGIGFKSFVPAGSPERDPAPRAKYSAFSYVISSCKPSAGSSPRDPAETERKMETQELVLKSHKISA